ncbi:MAG: DUF5667 domain-containing protein [Patescibacteria group bacterium]
MRLFKSIFLLVGALLLVLFSGGNISAVSPSPSPAAEVNSFELFWPLAPGKVMGDALYPIKSLKESVRGMFIFGVPQRVDYEVLLATKRVVEAEKLLKDGKSDAALKTLDIFLGKLDLSLSKWDEAKVAGNTPVSIKDNIRRQLNNLEVFLKFLASKNKDEVKVKVDQGLDKVMKLQNSL